jgi:hypothetical protein
MVYFLAVFMFHSIATMPTVYWLEEDCINAGKQMRVLYSCLGVLSGQANPRIQIPLDYPPEGYPDQPATGYADWETRRQFMHSTFRNVHELLEKDSSE